ncbi:MAG: hypothetical protein ABW250_23385 [Pyrinomonadaceae bacterium]
MSKVGKLNRRLFTLITLLACLTLVTPSNTPTTIAAPPPPPSPYQFSGTVNYWYYVANYPGVAIYKWNGSAWVYHGSASGNGCGRFTYDAGGPGEYKAVVDGYTVVVDSGVCPQSLDSDYAYVYWEMTASL